MSLGASDAERLARLEATEAIRQLPIRYALAADSRDIEALVSLYAEVDHPVYFPVDSSGIARDDLGAWVRASLAQYGTTQHFICGHLVEHDDSDHAHGSVYCLAGQERGEQWIVLAALYEDRYVRQRGEWRFEDRHTYPWYYTDWDEKPVGPHKLRLPGAPPVVAPLPDRWPSWRRFHGGDSADS